MDTKSSTAKESGPLKKQKTTDDLPAEPISWLEILPYFTCTALGFTGLLSEIYLGNFFMIIWIPFVILPILDYVLPVDHSNPTEERVRLLEKDKRFMVPLYAQWTLDIIVLFWLLHGVSTGKFG